MSNGNESNGNGMNTMWKALVVLGVAAGGVSTGVSAIRPGQDAQEQRIRDLDERQGVLDQRLANQGTLSATNATRITAIESEQSERLALFASVGEMTAAMKFIGESVNELKVEVKDLRVEIKELSKRP
jgi:hypothetical protein